MNVENLEFESIDEIYEILRNNLSGSYNRLLDTCNEIENNKKPVQEVINNILEYCFLSYHTIDAILQIQLGIIKKDNHSNISPGRG